MPVQRVVVAPAALWLVPAWAAAAAAAVRAEAVAVAAAAAETARA